MGRPRSAPDYTGRFVTGATPTNVCIRFSFNGPSGYPYAGSNPAPATMPSWAPMMPLTSANAGLGLFVEAARVRLCPARSGRIRLSVRNACGSLASRSGRSGSVQGVRDPAHGLRLLAVDAARVDLQQHVDAVSGPLGNLGG